MVREENGVSNANLGRGDRAIRVVEWALNRPDAPVMDLRLYSDRDEEPKGWQAFRASECGPVPAVGSGAVALNGSRSLNDDPASSWISARGSAVFPRITASPARRGAPKSR